MKKRTVNKILSFMLTAACTVTLLGGCGQTGSTVSSGTTDDGTTVTESYVAQLPSGVEDADIYVAPISGIDESFIRGMDVSSLISEENSGVKYYDENGEEQDLFRILADNGVNYIRVRVWNDPYDADGNGYGGGNCNADTACEIGSRCAAYGMKLNVDFHYSDFWADPSKQMCPKAWEDMSIEEKETAIYDYTVESLTKILDAGADVGMVQIGNEINNGMAGETSEENVLRLLNQASAAVRSISATYSKDIKIAVHFTNVDSYATINKKAFWLDAGKLDYDIFGISYYPYWHGTLDNMKYTMQVVKATYGKDVMVLETGFPYTGDDGDCFGNNVSADDITGEYICDAQSQANSVWDIMNTMAEIGGLGVFYWEGAWIPVGDNYDENSVIWEKYGSGWASKYAVDYDPDDAGKYYGGCSWDNQAFFDFDGNVLPSLGVFKYIFYGTECDEKLEFIDDCVVDISQGQELVMPEGVYGVYNNRSLNRIIPTTWNADDIAAIDTSVSGEYTVSGVTEDGYDVTATVNISYANLLTNSSFEDSDNGWTVGYNMAANPTDIQKKASDAHDGENAFHYWTDSEEQEFWVEQSVTAESDGTYSAFGYIQGGDAGDGYAVKFYIKVNGENVSEDDSATLTGWKNWSKTELTGVSASAGDEITVGMYVKCASGGWGTIDDFCLYKD